jgi:hypothetical protein
MPVFFAAVTDLSKTGMLFFVSGVEYGVGNDEAGYWGAADDV